MVSDNGTKEDILEENTTKNTEVKDDLASVVSLNADNGGEDLEKKTSDDIEQETTADAVQPEQTQSAPLEQGDIEPSNNNTEVPNDPIADPEAQPELILEDLEDYRETANIEEPEQLVDIGEFLELKRKADEARQKDGKKKKKKKKDDIFINRYKAKTINAAVAAADPIVYFYNAALDKTGKIRYFNVYQVLQDRFMGKLIPHQFTSVAEGSAKIEELNIANVIQQCKLCNEYPQYEFVISISTRFFTRPNILEKLRKELKAEHNNLVLAFDCVSLQNIGTAAKTGLSILRLAGAKIMLDNTEAVSMTSLTELEYDYIRIDARYFEKGAERPLVYLELLSRFAASQGIGTSSSFCDEGYLAEYMLTRGITAVQGDSVSRPMRTVPNAVKAVTLLPSMLD